MKLKANIYKKTNRGTLARVASGSCEMYVPTPINFKINDPYVSVVFGEYHIHINKDDFLTFCKSLI